MELGHGFLQLACSGNSQEHKSALLSSLRVFSITHSLRFLFLFFSFGLSSQELYDDV